MKIQFISDLHLEFRTDFKSLFCVSAPILCLLGDVCICAEDKEYAKFVSFLEYISPKYQYILHVAGNHEYYSTHAHNRDSTNTMEFTKLKLKTLEKKIKNYRFLDNKIFSIKRNNKKYNFIGTTLWTYIDESKRTKFKNVMNDYSDIYVMNELFTQTAKKGESPIKLNISPIRKFTPDDMVYYHKKSIRFIKRAMKKIKGKNDVNILLTHHKPIADSPIDQYSQAYEVDLKHLIKRPLHYALHGHTHRPYSKLINNVLCMSNPKGYTNQRTKFKQNLSIEI
jgi:predicted phosphodiesterase